MNDEITDMEIEEPVAQADDTGDLNSQMGDEVNNDDPVSNTSNDEDRPETFPREYVEKLRRENAGLRDRAKRSDDLAAALWKARVEATGRLQDPSDLPMPDDADPTDADTVSDAVDELLEHKPHLAARKVSGDIGQGPQNGSGDVDLAGLLRARAS